MSSLTVGEEQRLPEEIWKIIIGYCFWVDPQHHPYSVRASYRVIKRGFSRTSRWWRQLIENLTQHMQQFQDVLYPGSVTTYCSSHGYVSLLKYAIEQGALIESITVTEAARFGRLDCLKMLDERGCSQTLRKKGLDEAAKYGQLAVLKYYIDSNMTVNTSTVNNAVMSGSIKLFKYLQTMKGVQDYSELGYYAARSGSLPMVKYIEQYTPLNQRCIEGSAYGGSVEVLEYLLDKGLDFKRNENYKYAVVATAYGLRRKHTKYMDYVYYAVQRGAPIDNLLTTFVENNDLEGLQGLVALNAPKFQWNGHALDIAAAKGNLEIIKCLVQLCEEGSIKQDSYWAVKYAAERGHVDCLKYMIEKGARYNSESFANVQSEPVLQYLIELYQRSTALTVTAAEGLNLTALKYFHEHHCPWPENIIDHVVGRNRESEFNDTIAIIEFLREQKCVWTAQTCANAARASAVDVLKYLHKNGCPWDERTTAAAARESGDLAYFTLLYALDNGCPCNYEAMDNAARRSDQDILQLLFQRGIRWNNDTLTRIGERGYVSMLKYALENGAQWEEDTIYAIIRGGSFKCFEYAISNGCPWDPQLALQEAQNSENEDVVEWIQKKTQKIDDNKAPENPVPSSHKKPEEKCCIS